MTVGPESVGHNLTRDAKVFGGSVFTSTDLVVASGRAELGEKAKVQDVPAEVITLGLARIKKLLEGIIDKYATRIVTWQWPRSDARSHAE